MTPKRALDVLEKELNSYYLGANRMVLAYQAAMDALRYLRERQARECDVKGCLLRGRE